MDGKFFEEQRQVLRDRHTVHGNPIQGFATLGVAYAAILTEHLKMPIPPIEPEIVAAMCAVQKLLRAVRSATSHVCIDDDFIDGINYMYLMRSVLRSRLTAEHDELDETTNDEE